MTFEDLLAHVIAVLQREKRISYRALQRRFDLDDAYLDDVKVELIEAKQLARDENGRILVWEAQVATTVPPPTAQEGPPASLPVVQTASVHGASGVPAAERRQLTVLFCDLADSTRLARQLDPEDLREVIRAYQGTCVAVIQRFDGHVAQYLGDGLLVYFGYPQAHEDDAQRAVRTGLGILEAIGTLPIRLLRDPSGRLAVRIGIHTGLVVVGEMGSGDRHEHLALGDTPNLAARLQGLAAPNTVVISEATSRLVHGYFTCQDHGTHALKGIDTLVHVYQVIGESTAHSRLDVAEATGLTPLVGREAEVTLLQERWAQSTDGLGQVVVLSGEAGIGKSRLVYELIERVMDEHTPRLTFHCSPYHTNSALYPVLEYLKRLLHWQRNTSPEAKLATLEQAIQTARLPLAEVVPLVAALLLLPVSAHYPPLTLSPQRQKQKTLEALVAWLLAEAAQRPVLAIWEDLHWADPSTLELLGLLLDQASTARLLLVLTCRPEFRPPWSPRSYVMPLTLTRLLRPQVEDLVLRLTGGKPLPAEVLQQIVEKTDGIPLFVEELVKTIWESGLVREDAERYILTGLLPPLAIPTTLQDALMARLDRLAPVKAVAQLGAVLGREFSYALLRAVAPWEEATLQHALAQLVEAELLYQRGMPSQATYLFKHALVQDAAYQSLLRSTRQQYHQRIAQVLEEQLPETANTQPELLAHHYTEAGLAEQAIPYWHQAGQRAIERSANVEAIQYLRTGLALLTTLPETYERTQHELTFHLALGPALIAARGYASPDVEQTYARAHALCQQVGDTPQLFPVLRGLHRFYLVRGQFQTAHAFSEQCFRLAQQTQDTDLVLDAQFALGESLFYLGELTSAQEYLTQGFALYTATPQSSPVFRVVQDLGVSYLVHLAWLCWLGGWPQQALQRCTQALVRVQHLAHPFSQAYALNFMTMFQQLRGDLPAAQEQAVATATLSATHGFPVFEGLGRLMHGWARAAQGDADAGLAQLLQGWNAYQATGAALFRSYFLSLLADTYRRLRLPEDGLRVLADALAAEQTSGEGFYTAELHRLRGELLLQTVVGVHRPGDASTPSVAQHPQASEAETCFHQACALARHQQARALELRAATSLARLWQHQDRRTEARELLAPIYSWFTEGFDTVDLQEAKARLEKLG